VRLSEADHYCGISRGHCSIEHAPLGRRVQGPGVARGDIGRGPARRTSSGREFRTRYGRASENTTKVRVCADEGREMTLNPECADSGESPRRFAKETRRDKAVGDIAAAISL